MTLDERKLQILETIVREYIQSAEPIGSRTLSKNPKMKISSATIRNEMADLEEMGYLYQPHTSAGRVPSEKAYRLYVDQLMTIMEFGGILQEEIKSVYNTYMDEFTEAIQRTARLLSRITSYTAFSMAPQAKHLNCKFIKLILLGEMKVLLVLVTKERIVRNYVITLTQPASEAILDKVGNVLNICLKDITLYELNDSIMDKLDALTEEEKSLLLEMIPLLKEILIEEDRQRVYADGLDKIFNFPEFADDIERAKKFIETLNHQTLLAHKLTENIQRDLSIQIGEENVEEAFKDCSVVTATYKIDGKPIGTFGVVGPTRMNYDYVVSVLDFLRKEFNAQISRMIND